MIKVRPINCSQCGATIEMTKIVNTGCSDVFKCEYCGTMLEIVGYRVHDNTISNKYALPSNQTVTPIVRTLADIQKSNGVGSVTQAFFWLFIVGIIGSLFLLPEAWSQATKHVGLLETPNVGLLFFIITFDSFAVPLVFIWGLILQNAKQQYNNYK